jgi:hypothetical protein
LCVTPLHSLRPSFLTGSRGRVAVMKKVLELILCIFHPLAVVLIWINLAVRTDLSPGKKLVWALFVIIPLVPFLYVLTGGDLW